MIDFFKNNNLTAPSLIIGFAIIFTGLVFGNSANIFANKTDSITVTGSTERIVLSDTAKWQITVNVRSKDIKSGNEAILLQINTLKSYLRKNSVDLETVGSNSVSNYPICQLSSQGYENCSLGIVGYNFSQSLLVQGSDVDLLTKLSENVSVELSNINLSQSIEYYYNNLKNIRAEMLSEATKNALERAQSVADAGGAKIGKITSLSSGVFQVTAQNSVNFDDYGSYDTTQITKKITATVKANFSVK